MPVDKKTLVDEPMGTIKEKEEITFYDRVIEALKQLLSIQKSHTTITSLLNIQDKKSLFILDKEYFCACKIGFVLYNILQSDKFILVDIPADFLYNTVIYDTFTEYNKSITYICDGYYFFKSNKESFIIKLDKGGLADHIRLWCDIKNKETAEKFFRLIEEKEYQYFTNKILDGNLAPLEFDRKYTWDDIILESWFKEQIDDNVIKILNQDDLYAKNNIKFKRGILLEGPPGTGKTLLGKVLACQLGYSFLWLTSYDLTRNLKLYFTLARAIKPCVIFMEDIDLIGQDRYSGKVLNEVLGELLNQLDGLNDNDSIVVIGTTNHKDILDDALKNRPCRFDIHLKLDYCDNGIITDLLKLYLKDTNYVISDLDKMATLLQNKVEKLTPAHIFEFVVLLKIYAIKNNMLDSNNIANILYEQAEDVIDLLVNSNNISISIGFNSK